MGERRARARLARDGRHLDDDVTQEATAEMATLAMTPDQEARRAASVAGLGFDSRQARER